MGWMSIPALEGSRPGTFAPLREAKVKVKVKVKVRVRVIVKGDREGDREG
jgi:hypothetical protein